MLNYQLTAAVDNSASCQAYGVLPFCWRNLSKSCSNSLVSASKWKKKFNAGPCMEEQLLVTLEHSNYSIIWFYLISFCTCSRRLVSPSYLAEEIQMCTRLKPARIQSNIFPCTSGNLLVCTFIDFLMVLSNNFPCFAVSRSDLILVLV